MIFSQVKRLQVIRVVACNFLLTLQYSTQLFMKDSVVNTEGKQSTGYISGGVQELILVLPKRCRI